MQNQTGNAELQLGRTRAGIFQPFSMQNQTGNAASQLGRTRAGGPGGSEFFVLSVQ